MLVEHNSSAFQCSYSPRHVNQPCIALCDFMAHQPTIKFGRGRLCKLAMYIIGFSMYGRLRRCMVSCTLNFELHSITAGVPPTDRECLLYK